MLFSLNPTGNITLLRVTGQETPIPLVGVQVGFGEDTKCLPQYAFQPAVYRLACFVRCSLRSLLSHDYANFVIETAHSSGLWHAGQVCLL